MVSITISKTETITTAPSRTSIAFCTYLPKCGQFQGKHGPKWRLFGRDLAQSDAALAASSHVLQATAADDLHDHLNDEGSLSQKRSTDQELADRAEERMEPRRHRLRISAGTQRELRCGEAKEGLRSHTGR